MASGVLIFLLPVLYRIITLQLHCYYFIQQHYYCFILPVTTLYYTATALHFLLLLYTPLLLHATIFTSLYEAFI